MKFQTDNKGIKKFIFNYGNCGMHNRMHNKNGFLGKEIDKKCFLSPKSLMVWKIGSFIVI